MQTVKAVYIRSRKLFLPFKFPQSIFGINDTLRYFIKGEGYKKTLAYDIVDIEIPTTKDVFQDIKETSQKYGRAICMEYLITNNAVYWKENLYLAAMLTTLSRTSQETLQNGFKTKNPLLFFEWFGLCSGLAICDIVGVDEYMHKELGYKESKHGSMADFMKNEMPKGVHAEFEKLLQ
jgi:hypothetical protein